MCVRQGGVTRSPRRAANELREPREGFGVEPGERRSRIRSASAESTGSRTGRQRSSTSSACRTREITCTARSEWPPSSKKSSPRPTRSTPSSSAQISASACSISPTGASYAARRVGVALRGGQRLAVQLAVRRERQLLQPHVRRRHHVLRQRSRQVRAQRLRVRRGLAAAPRTPPAACRPARPRAPAPPPRARPRARASARLDLAQLDAEAADLHLDVDAAQELQRPVRAASAPRSPVRYSRAPGRRRTGRRRSAPPSAPGGPGSRAPRRRRRRTARPPRPPAPARRARRARRSRAFGDRPADGGRAPSARRDTSRRRRRRWSPRSARTR